jgi:hypothetical protein
MFDVTEITGSGLLDWRDDFGLGDVIAQFAQPIREFSSLVDRVHAQSVAK